MVKIEPESGVHLGILVGVGGGGLRAVLLSLPGLGVRIGFQAPISTSMSVGTKLSPSHGPRWAARGGTIGGGDDKYIT